MKNKLIVAILAIFMINAVVSNMTLVNAKSASGTCGTSVEWCLSDDGVLTIRGTGAIKEYSQKKSYPWYNYADDIIKIIIEEGVTRIPQYSFSGCTKLESITIPSSITEIGNAFYISAPINEVYISDLAAWCAIKFTRKTSNPLYYGGKLYINGEVAENVVIPENVTSIGDFTFCNYDYLKSIVVPESVISIGNSAVNNCDNLTDIYYMGIEEEWNKITIDMNNDFLKKVTLSNGDLMVYPGNAEIGNCIFIACYNNNVMTYVDVCNYNDEEYIIFSPDAQYDVIKIFLWQNLSSIKPLEM